MKLRTALGLSTVVIVALGASVGSASRSAAVSAGPVPGALPKFDYRHNDTYHGWPLAPVDEEHPIRASFLDPRKPSEQGNYHIGIDISWRDDQPEPGAPPGRSHRVYAIEGGVADCPPTRGPWAVSTGW